MLNMLSNFSGAVTGQQEYITAGCYTWVAPAGVTAISAVAVGGGGGGSNNTGNGRGGGGGELQYRNNLSVTPLCSYPVTVGVGGPAATNAGVAILMSCSGRSIWTFPERGS